MWTIEYNRVEKSAADWGLNADPVLHFRVQAAAEFHFKMAGFAPEAAIPIPFEAPVIIRQNRTGTGTAWANDASAWHFVFRGRQITQNGQVSGSGQAVSLIFQDAWYDLENMPFQQSWVVSGGTAFFSRAYLFYNGATVPASYLTVAQQVTAIIAFAASAGANIQPGIIEGGSQMPWYAVRGLSCADAIKKCLECFPDLVTWIDGSTNPPTFHCRYRAGLAVITLPWKGTDARGRAHKSGQIKPRYDLAPSQVVIQYQKTVAVGSTSGVALITDAYPPASTGMALRALVVPIDLRGATASFAKTQIVTQSFDPTDVVGFWQTHVKSLKDADIVGTPALVDATINGSGQQGITVMNGDIPVDLTAYPREMVRPSKWASWTGVNVIEATVTCYLNYEKAKKIGTAATPRTTDKIPAHFHTVKIKLCNAPPGSTNYQTETAYDSGETAVTGLAQNIYASLNQLQFEGNHEIVEQGAVSQIIGPWNVLNLTGGATAWATMAASIPEVEINFFTNSTRINIGPARHLSPQDLNNYKQFFRMRIMFDNAQTSSGRAIGAAPDQSGDVPLEDANSGSPQHATKEIRDADELVPANTNLITHNAAKGQITLQQFGPAGDLVPNTPSVTVKLGDLLDATNKDSAHRWFSVCDSAGNLKKAKFLSTLPE